MFYQLFLLFFGLKCTCITLVIQLISNHLLLGKYPNSSACDSDFIPVYERLVGTLRLQLLTRTRFRSCVLSVSGWRAPHSKNWGQNFFLFDPVVLNTERQDLSGVFKVQWILSCFMWRGNNLLSSIVVTLLHPHHLLLPLYPYHQLLPLYPHHQLLPLYPHHQLLPFYTPIISCYPLHPHHQLLTPIPPLSVVTPITPIIICYFLHLDHQVLPPSSVITHYIFFISCNPSIPHHQL